MSSITFQEPIAEDGTLPIRLFGKAAHRRSRQAWRPGYQSYALKDELVTPACATAANKFLAYSGLLESVPFPGGHVAILTSPYSKKSPVDGRFKGKDGTTTADRCCSSSTFPPRSWPRRKAKGPVSASKGVAQR